MTDDSDHKTSASIETPRARLVCLDPSQIDGAPDSLIITLGAGSEVVVGRGETCSFPIVSRKLSRQHVRLFAGVGAWGVEDLNSTNGIMINRQKVKTAWLNHGDEVRIGPIPFRYEIDRPDLPGSGPDAPAAKASARAGTDTAVQRESGPSGGGGKLAGILVAVLLLAAAGGGAYLFLSR